MRYPVYDARENPSVMTRAFSGINRKPYGTEGEGREARGFSLSAYPVLCSRGYEEAGRIMIKSGEAYTVCTADGLQCIAEVSAQADGYLLTGVYCGKFYYMGAETGYYKSPGEEYEIAEADRVEIAKTGAGYVILACKPGENGRSVLWSYKKEGTSTSGGDKEGDGLLQCARLLQLAPPQFESTYLYRFKSSRYNDFSELERALQKTYYALILRKEITLPTNGNYITTDSDGGIEATVDKRIYSYAAAAEQYGIYNAYAGYYGARVEIVPELYDGYFFSEDGYCFDDTGSEFPVRFIVDAAAASAGRTAPDFSVLFENERAAYGSKVADGLGQMEAAPAEYLIGIEDSNPKAAEPSCVYVPQFIKDEENGTYARIIPAPAGGAVIGHFEKWNSDKRRYEAIYNDDGIYKVMHETEDGQTEEVTDGDDRTAIPVKAAWIDTEASRAAHMTVWNNRLCAVTADGKMVLISALGEYTEFAEYEGAETDSGYINSSTDGCYTAVTEYNGSLLAFKESCIEIYMGSSPQDITLTGVIKGVGCSDSKSIVEVCGILFFLSEGKFYAYTGGRPQCISEKLAKKYEKAAAYRSEDCYCAVCEEETLVYNTSAGGWTALERIGEKLCGDMTVNTEGVLCRQSEESGTDWLWESCELWENISDYKGIEELYIRAAVCGSMKVYTVSGNEERLHKTIEDETGEQRVWRVSVRMRSADAYRIKLEGRGKVTVYAIERVVYAGGRAR